MTTRRRKKVGAFAVAVVITLVLGACTGDGAGASQGATKLANPTQTLAAAGGAETGPTETGPAETGPAETGPAETAPAETAPPPAQAALDVQEPATCEFVQPRARAHLELTDSGDRIKARFVLHQMTSPGHLWRIVFRHADASECCAPPGADDFGVAFEGTRLATGDSGDITVQRSIVDYAYDVVTAKARDRQTGQLCRVRRAGL
jgi:hypothetical protein